MLQKSGLALQFAYQRKRGRIEATEDGEWTSDKENRAREWAEDNWRRPEFLKEAEKQLDILGIDYS